MSVDILIVCNRIRNDVVDFVSRVIEEAGIEDERLALILALRLAKMQYYSEAKRILKQKFEKVKEELLVILTPIKERLSEETQRKIEAMMRW